MSNSQPRRAMEDLGSHDPEEHQKPRHGPLSRLLAAAFYGVTSVSITLFNKAVFSVYEFRYPNIVTTYQICLSLLLIMMLQRLTSSDKITFSIATAKQVFPLTLMWWLYVVSGLTALRYLNVPMFSTLRRATTVIVMFGEFAAFKKKPSCWSMMAVALITTGAVVASFTDLTYSPQGYFYVAICVFSTAAYLILIRVLKEKTGLSDAGLLYYNNLLSLPLMLVYLFTATTEAQDVIDYPRLWEPKFQLFLLISASQAFLLNLAIFRCTTVNSPLTTSVTGQVKDIATTGLGFTLFGDVIPNSTNVVGVVTGLCGGLLYSMIAYLERNRPRRASK